MMGVDMRRRMICPGRGGMFGSLIAMKFKQVNLIEINLVHFLLNFIRAAQERCVGDGLV